MRPVIRLPGVSGEGPLTAAIEILVAIDRLYRRGVLGDRVAGGGYPSASVAGVRYAREPAGEEVWQTTPDLLARRRGDCEDLVADRIAELREAGETTARPDLMRRGLLWHVRVRRGDGSIEDPSLALGMRP